MQTSHIWVSLCREPKGPYVCHVTMVLSEMLHSQEWRSLTGT